MVRIEEPGKKLSLEEIEQFETKNNVKLTEKYKKFLLQWNGGYPEPNIFNISDEQGKSVLNVFNSIGDMYDNLEKVIDIYEYRLPTGFIPIADDPAGNVICLGTKEPYYDKIYFWDHEEESENPDDMSNMYILADDINEFLDNLYEDDEE
ncbi:SMI1/KNR4 family protein [Bacillus haynesii]|nr:SMI1/KNR4 family protein [Bacillus haynesii]